MGVGHCVFDNGVFTPQIASLLSKSNVGLVTVWEWELPICSTQQQDPVHHGKMYKHESVKRIHH